MNNRFKFRCYNKFQEKMFDVKNISYINGIVKRIEVQDDERILIFDEWQNNIDNTVLMQCTGLKDKNGKLIYEGDIVKYKDEVYGLCIGKIEWDNAHYEFQYYTGEKYGWFSHILCLKHIKNIEVIGNIYENKELLESEG